MRSTRTLSSSYGPASNSRANVLRGGCSSENKSGNCIRIRLRCHGRTIPYSANSPRIWLPRCVRQLIQAGWNLKARTGVSALRNAVRFDDVRINEAPEHLNEKCELSNWSALHHSGGGLSTGTIGSFRPELTQPATITENESRWAAVVARDPQGEISLCCQGHSRVLPALLRGQACPAWETCSFSGLGKMGSGQGSVCAHDASRTRRRQPGSLEKIASA
jgi:hypothetical protein